MLQQKVLWKKCKLEQQNACVLRIPPPHDYPYYWVILYPKSKDDRVKGTNLKNLPKFHIFKVWNKLYTRHSFWSCLIICANMKWVRWVLLKIQSGHHSVHRRSDGRMDRRTRWNQYTPFQLRWSEGYNNAFIWAPLIINQRWFDTKPWFITCVGRIIPVQHS